MANKNRLLDAWGLVIDIAKRVSPLIDNKCCKSQHIYDGVMRCIAEAPTVETVEVVRCKNCEWSECYRGVTLCNNPCGMFGKVTAESFCSCGERRGGE